MKKILIIFSLLVTSFIFSQKIQYYNYGYDGIQAVGRLNDSNFVYSQYKARPLIMNKVCSKILTNIKTIKNGPYIINFDRVKVIGTIKIKRKDKSIFIEYYYERIEYADTLVEIYKKPPLKPIK